MRNVQETNDGPGGDPLAVVEAFIDGEPVAPRALKDALADAAGRDYLLDLLVLRGIVSRIEAPAAHEARVRAGRATRLPWLAAAAAALISLLAGYLAGQRVVAPVEARTVQAFVESQSTPMVPAPTRIIPLRPGIDWTETSGEQ